MKKKIFLVLLGILCGSAAYADEMVINFESGNTLIIQYTGSINGVSLQGGSDTITAMKTQRTGEKKSVVKSSPLSQQDAPIIMETKPTENMEQKNKVKFGWAAPIMED